MPCIPELPLAQHINNETLSLHTAQTQIHLPCTPQLLCNTPTLTTPPRNAFLHSQLPAAAPQHHKVYIFHIMCMHTNNGINNHAQLEKRASPTIALSKQGESITPTSHGAPIGRFPRASNATTKRTLQRESMMATFACAVHNDCTS